MGAKKVWEVPVLKYTQGSWTHNMSVLQATLWIPTGYFLPFLLPTTHLPYTAHAFVIVLLCNTLSPSRLPVKHILALLFLSTYIGETWPWPHPVLTPVRDAQFYSG